MSDSLRHCSVAEAPLLQASKWLQVQLLLDPEEMGSLLSFLGDVHIFKAGALCREGETELSHRTFVEGYARYIEFLRNGEIPPDAVFRGLFSAVFTLNLNALYCVKVSEGECIVRMASPAIQLQPHAMQYSKLENKFRPMVFGLDTILWGIQFSYPQLYQDNESKEIRKVADEPHFPNTALFKKLQLWQRENTVPTPFQVPNGEKINIPMRLGKNCLAWINRHPQLAAQGLKVVV